jgi:serine/threonine-protein kinase mTOR
LQHVSPELVDATSLQLCVPGTYRTDQEVVAVQSFVPSLTVITSKQRPRKLAIIGSDGNSYNFLLKGHEDLRQDERVMQLFGLVNTLLAHDMETVKRHLHIQRYSVCPLSPNSGVIGWVPHHDTLHALIREYRDSRKIVLNIEHRLMLQMNSEYENLMLIQKVEVCCGEQRAESRERERERERERDDTTAARIVVLTIALFCVRVSKGI